MTKEERLKKKLTRILIQCIKISLNEKMDNPKFEITADVSDGSKYRLIFERTDLD